MANAPRAQIVLAGDELLTGHRRDVIGPRLAGQLEALGCQLVALQMLPDAVELIASAVRGAVSGGVDVVVVCGGLGPTEDDRTREGVAAGLGVELELDAAAFERIEARYRERGRDVPPGARRQAMRPAGAEVVKNPVGTAPGFMIEKSRSLIVALPGVPREFDTMFDRVVAPLLRTRLVGGQAIVSTLLRVAGLMESEVHRRLVGALDEEASGRVKYFARPGDVELIVSARGADRGEAADLLAETVAAIRHELGDHVYGEGDVTLVGVVRDALLEHGWTLSTAESCTGGLLGTTITDLAGSSAFYVGGVVAYHNEEKRALLGVPESLLERCGAVSSDVARVMATGCRERLGTSVALSVTGIAGPEGGSADKPVGLVYLGVATPDEVRVFKHTFTGDRAAIRQRAAMASLDELRRVLASRPPLGQEIAQDAGER